MEGVDVAYPQGTIKGKKWVSVVDWKKVAASGRTFAIIKATQGLTRNDPVAMAHATGAKAAGLKIGYYHFANINNAPDKEALHFHEVVKTLPKPDLYPVLDIETNNDSDKAKQQGVKPLTPIQIQEWIKNYIAALAKLGYAKTVIYSYRPFLDVNLPANHPFGSNPLWIAQYNKNAAPKLPRGWKDYVIWQYSGTGKLDGVPVPIDLNRSNSLAAIEVAPAAPPVA